MERKRFSPFTVLASLGTALLGALGMGAVIRWLARPVPAPPVGGNAPRGIPAAQRAPIATPQVVDTPRTAPRVMLKPGWQRVEDTHLPRPTSWPVALAFAITLLAWGLVTTWIISAVGLALLAVSIAGWIGELLHEH